MICYNAGENNFPTLLTEKILLSKEYPVHFECLKRQLVETTKTHIKRKLQKTSNSRREGFCSAVHSCSVANASK